MLRVKFKLNQDFFESRSETEIVAFLSSTYPPTLHTRTFINEISLLVVCVTSNQVIVRSGFLLISAYELIGNAVEQIIQNFLI
jgi:hypothetical protein